MTWTITGVKGRVISVRLRSGGVVLFSDWTIHPSQMNINLLHIYARVVIRSGFEGSVLLFDLCEYPGLE